MKKKERRRKEHILEFETQHELSFVLARTKQLLAVLHQSAQPGQITLPRRDLRTRNILPRCTKRKGERCLTRGAAALVERGCLVKGRCSFFRGSKNFG